VASKEKGRTIGPFKRCQPLVRYTTKREENHSGKRSISTYPLLALWGRAVERKEKMPTRSEACPNHEERRKEKLYYHLSLCEREEGKKSVINTRVRKRKKKEITGKRKRRSS